MKKLLAAWAVALLCVTASSSSAAGQDMKLGVINAQKVLENTKAGQKATAGLEAFVRERQEIINREEDGITKLKEQLDKQGAVLSPKARDEKQAELERRIGEYQKKVGDMTREVQKKRTEVLRAFNDRMEKAVSRIAEQEGIALVLDRNAEGGAVVYAKDSLDMTDKVTKEYDKMTP